MKGAYYNDNDPFCAEWLRRLIAAGVIPAGEVDERSIADIDPSDLRGFAHVHFFAGIGGWAYALQLAGWDMDRPLWTGSCPCQPFSSAGRQGGATDERHLWPRWLRLIRECRPDAILGEQVEGAVGFGWIDRVFADLEAQGYACGAAVLGAHSVGAPHIRQRLYWVAHSEPARPWPASHQTVCGGEPGTGWSGAAGGMADASGQRRQQVGRGAFGDEGADGRQPDGDHLAAGNGTDGGMADAQRAGVWGAAREDAGAAREVQGEVGERQRLRADPGAGGGVLRERLADADEAGSDRQRRQGLSGNGHAPQRHDADGCGEAGGMADASNDGHDRSREPEEGPRPSVGPDREVLGQSEGGSMGNAAREQMGRARQPWQDSVWLPCLDGKARRVVAALQPLAHAGECICGLRLGELCACGERRPSRVGMLRGSGNAIAPAVAAEFIRAVLDCIP